MTRRMATRHVRVPPNARDNGVPALVDRIASDEGFLLRHLLSEHIPIGQFCVPKFSLI